jgi:acyl transferase domain-containing protein
MNGLETINSLNCIAVVGLSGRFPGGNDTPEKLWASLSEAKNCISYFSSDELERHGIAPGLLNERGYVRASPVLEGIEYFDAALFGITPPEAELMDPQHRILLECCWSALENAGYNPLALRRETGVFVGARTDTYLGSLLTNNSDLVHSIGLFNLGLTNDFGFLATRVSHCFNLTGPSYSVQTACSTSLVCVHLACQSLLLGECGMALAGGVAVNVPHITGYQYQEGSVLSPDGYCRPFDAKARGTIFGSGVGIVVLKRLDDALADGDCIRGIILGSAVNNDGAKKANFTAPGVQGQVKVIRAALRNSGVTPESISYVEAHGTGTLLGDAIEVRALGKAFQKDRKHPCAIGSVKGNLGHLDAAAGVVGLIKVLLSLEHRQLPPSLYFEQPNPQIDFEESGFYVNTQLQEWSSNGKPRRAGVSAFGVGGTNAHIVVQEAPQQEESGESRPHQLLVFSGKTAKAEKQAVEQWVECQHRPRTSPLADVAYTLSVGRQRFEHRRAVTCRDWREAVEKIQADEWVARNEGEEDIQAVALLFPGQGAKLSGVGRELYALESVFRKEMDRCSEILQRRLGMDPLKALYDGSPLEIQQTSITQPALAATEYALAQLWNAWGIRPEIMLGHSLGEYVAACLAGVMELEDMLHLVSVRGRLMEGMEKGAMAAVEAGEEELNPRLGDGLWLAAVNGPRLCTVSGREAAIEEFCEEWSQQKRMVRRLHTSHAFHCPLMAPMVDTFVGEIAKKNLKPPQARYISSLTGDWAGEECRNADYWGEQLLRPVRFAEGMKKLLEEENLALLEVGPEQLASMIRAQNPGARMFSSLAGAGEQESMLKALGALWCAGAEVSWTKFYEQQRRHRVPLPGYPFQRSRYWIDPQTDNQDRTQVSAAPAKQKKIHEIDRWFWSPGWQMEARKSGSVAFDQRWVVFEDDAGVGREFARALREQGGFVVSVLHCSHFRQADEQTYFIDPNSPSDYAELSQQLLKAGFVPSHIFHAWGLTEKNAAADTVEFFADFQPKGFYSLVHMAAHCIEHGWPCRFIVLSNDSVRVQNNDAVSAAKAGPTAFCKVLPQENPGFSAVFVDISIDSAKQSPHWLCESLLGELELSHSSPVIAYRGKRRWVQYFEKRELLASLPVLRPGGVYLITGGMGSIGLLLAQHLAGRFQAKIVLTGRTCPSEATPETALSYSTVVEKIQAAGGELLFCRADVADEQAMALAVSQCLEKFGGLNGIIHAAGVTHGSSLFRLVKETRAADCSAQAHAKIHGLYTIEKLSRGLDLDFVLAMSSNAGVLGGMGFLSYAAANSAMDVFVSRPDFDRSPTRWISANWDHWPEQTRKYLDVHTSMDEFAMTLDEATQALEAVLGCDDSGQIVVSTGYLPDRLGLWLGSSQRARKDTQMQDPSRRSPRPHMRSVYLEPRNGVEAKLAEVWAEVLGLEKVGVNDDFFELGGHSLLATTLISRMEETMATKISLKVFFQGPTVAQLAVSASSPLSANSVA